MLKRHKSRDDTELDACIAATLQECRNAGCVEDELALALLEALGHLILQCQECSGSEALRLTNCLRQEIAAHMARKMMADFELVPLMIEVDQDLVMEACSAWRELIAMALAHDDDETAMVLAEKLLSLVLTIDPDWLDTATAMEIVAAARAADEDWLDNGGDAAEILVSVN
ncbi:MAG TPA: hypothetical protein VF920_14440 [Dongiaceae bacterium]